jgi:hypothetical protein
VLAGRPVRRSPQGRIRGCVGLGIALITECGARTTRASRRIADSVRATSFVCSSGHACRLPFRSTRQRTGLAEESCACLRTSSNRESGRPRPPRRHGAAGPAPRTTSPASSLTVPSELPATAVIDAVPVLRARCEGHQDQERRFLHGLPGHASVIYRQSADGKPPDLELTTVRPTAAPRGARVLCLSPSRRAET